MHSLRSSRAAVAPAPSIRAALAAALACLAVLAAVALAPAAHAHDQLVATDPESGAVLAQTPETLGLTFSGEVQEIGSAFELTAQDGTDYPSTATIERTQVTVTPTEALPAGDYTLSWRVISSDGHPIEGTTANGQAVTFSVAGAPADSGGAEPSATQPADGTADAEPSAAASSAAAPQDDQGQDDQVQGTDAQDSEQAAGDPMAALWIALAAIAAAALVWILAAKAKRVTEGQQRPDQTSEGDDSAAGGRS
ncbi:copper resistance protein CopC [Zhihengliuella sp.]|uniref:copper resistance CopC family protein n=1 Tax=Zhihengliuella sp. TaxID=1954483 RepID=UPI0028113B39|nr:copper resistance protein CopC [Zhihengliuella sp.]